MTSYCGSRSSLRSSCRTLSIVSSRKWTRMSESNDEKPKKRKYRTAAEQVADRKAEKEAIAERRRKKKRRTRDKHNHRKWRAKKRAEQTREELEAKRAEQAAARAARREQTEQEKAQIELARRELARRRLLPFIHRFNPGYLAGWFHKDLCARLEKFLDDVVNQRSPRLMLFVPPRHGKSITVSQHFPPWAL